MNTVQEILQMEKFAKENGLQLSGHILGIVKRAETGKEEIVIDQLNTIWSQLKDNMRDTMNSNVDFALDNLQATQVAQASLSAALNGKDGLIVFDNSAGVLISDALAFMASAVHPIDPTGDYYRQWQGVYQNLTGSTEYSTKAMIGNTYSHVPASTPFIEEYSRTLSGYSVVTLLDNDIITINWKISIG